MNKNIRYVARVLVINDIGQTFLLRGRDPAAPDRAPFWFTPGGEIDDGETPVQAACRELYEEIGVIASPSDLGEVIGEEDCQYNFNGISYRQQGVFFAYRTNQAHLNTTHWSDIERLTIDQGKWWSVAELEITTHSVYPEHLRAMLHKALAAPST